jgi:DeoR family glycerol-3-phosphate regulon repressor
MSDLNDRQRQIVDLVRTSGLQSINELSAMFDVATQTIRKDINALCDLGLARRVHGGVVAPSNPVNLTFRSRRILNEEAKRDIGRAAAALIPHGSSVLLGIGTTVQYVAEALLDHADMTIVTNNLEVATILCNMASAEVHLIGGILRPEDRDLVGTAVVNGYREFSADFGVIGAGGLHAANGILDFKLVDAEINRTIVTQSRNRLLVADGSKWDKAPLHVVTGFEQIDTLVTDTAPRLPDGAPDLPMQVLTAG